VPVLTVKIKKRKGKEKEHIPMLIYD